MTLNAAATLPNMVSHAVRTLTSNYMGCIWVNGSNGVHMAFALYWLLEIVSFSFPLRWSNMSKIPIFSVLCLVSTDVHVKPRICSFCFVHVALKLSLISHDLWCLSAPRQLQLCGQHFTFNNKMIAVFPFPLTGRGCHLDSSVWH